MLDTLHQAASIVREQNTGAAQRAIDDAGLLDDATLLTALEALLNVLPAMANPEKAKKVDPNLVGASCDFDALEKLRRLAFSEQVPAPVQKTLFDDLPDNGEEADDGRGVVVDSVEIPLLPAHTWETSYRHEDGDLVRLFYVPASRAPSSTTG